MRRRALKIPTLILFVFLIVSPRVVAADRIQRSVAIAEAFVPVVLLVTQGTDTPFELGVFGASVLLQSVPNVLMLFGESAARPQLTQIVRWTNFGIDSALAAGLFGVGVAYLVGAFGPETDVRSLGAYYLGLSLPAAVAAFVDFLPFSMESLREPSPGALAPESQIPASEDSLSDAAAESAE